MPLLFLNNSDLSSGYETEWVTMSSGAPKNRIRHLSGVVARSVQKLVWLVELILVLLLSYLLVLMLYVVIRDLLTLKPEAPASSIHLIVSDILVVVVVVELIRSFAVLHPSRERILEGLLEFGIIVLVREVARSVIVANMSGALMACGGVVLLTIALWVLRSWVKRSQ